MCVLSSIVMDCCSVHFLVGTAMLWWHRSNAYVYNMPCEAPDGSVDSTNVSSEVPALECYECGHNETYRKLNQQLLLQECRDGNATVMKKFIARCSYGGPDAAFCMSRSVAVGKFNFNYVPRCEGPYRRPRQTKCSRFPCQEAHPSRGLRQKRAPLGK